MDSTGGSPPDATRRVTVDVARGCFEPIIGLPLVRAALGWGSFLSFDFGAPRGQPLHSHNVAVMFSGWRIESDEAVLAGSSELPESIVPVLLEFEGSLLLGASIDPSTGDLRLDLSGGRRLLTFTHTTVANDEEPCWYLFGPAEVLTVMSEAEFTLSPFGRRDGS